MLGSHWSTTGDWWGIVASDTALRRVMGKLRQEEEEEGVIEGRRGGRGGGRRGGRQRVRRRREQKEGAGGGNRAQLSGPMSLEPKEAAGIVCI